MRELGDAELSRVWNQQFVPVLYRSEEKGKKLAVRLPFDRLNRYWLAQSGRTKPVWNDSEKYWELPVAWFSNLTNRCLEKFGKCYIIQPFRDYEKCSPSCRNATGHECNCSCMGENHGTGDGSGWFDVSDAFSIKWGNKSLACRLLVLK